MKQVPAPVSHQFGGLHRVKDHQIQRSRLSTSGSPVSCRTSVCVRCLFCKKPSCFGCDSQTTSTAATSTELCDRHILGLHANANTP